MGRFLMGGSSGKRRGFILGVAAGPGTTGPLSSGTVFRADSRFLLAPRAVLTYHYLSQKRQPSSPGRYFHRNLTFLLSPSGKRADAVHDELCVQIRDVQTRKGRIHRVCVCVCRGGSRSGHVSQRRVPQFLEDFQTSHIEANVRMQESGRAMERKAGLMMADSSGKPQWF